MGTLREFLEKINIDGSVRYDEPLSAHTTFRIGGPADAFVSPRTAPALSRLLAAAREAGHPCIVLGGGANVLAGDRGARGIVVSTLALSGVSDAPGDGNAIRAGAGVPVTALCDAVLERSLSGLEFAAGLPGSTGGAVYMNARCYDREFADVLASVDYLEPADYAPRTAGVERAAWSYKRTPFMPGGLLEGAVITGATFSLGPGDRGAIEAAMRAKEADRAAKGHFDWPSAGSLFKNDRSFGRPTGMILDELGFRGRRVGDAMVSLKHANIFVNAGNASAADMLALIGAAQGAAREAFGIDLEPEVAFIGEF